MVRVRVLKQCFDGRQIRQVGEEFDFPGTSEDLKGSPSLVPVNKADMGPPSIDDLLDDQPAEERAPTSADLIGGKAKTSAPSWTTEGHLANQPETPEE